jgi:hypothetical protein
LAGRLSGRALPGSFVGVQSAAMAGVDAGVMVTCSGCGNTLLQKSMVPLLMPPELPDGTSTGPPPMGYLCIPCARLRIAIPVEAAAT